MDPRIGSISLTVTTPRQTPNNDFGTVFARTVASVAKVGGQVLGGVIGGSPALSAAVSGIQRIANATGTTPSRAGTIGGGGGDGWDLLAAQQAMMAEGQKFNASYLKLQDDMQKESREFNAVSNIMKVRHDSAKAAINNIR